MNLTLASSALLMGLAGSPHCVSMCGAACTALCAGPAGSGTGLVQSRLLSFHAARLLSYAVAGGVVASSVDLMARWGQTVSVLRPLWVLVHLAALGLGLYLLWQGRQPAWFSQLGRASPQLAMTPVKWAGGRSPDGRRGGGASSLRAGVAGLAWVAWPCGLLQSALVVAALADGAWGGAGTMAAFAVGSAIGLLLGPALFLRLLKRDVDEARGMSWAIRLAGLGLALSSGWALAHGVWQQIAAYCQ